VRNVRGVTTTRSPQGAPMPTLVDRPGATSVTVLAPHPDDELLSATLVVRVP